MFSDSAVFSRVQKQIAVWALYSLLPPLDWRFPSLNERLASFSSHLPFAGFGNEESSNLVNATPHISAADRDIGAFSLPLSSNDSKEVWLNDTNEISLGDPPGTFFSFGKRPESMNCSPVTRHWNVSSSETGSIRRPVQYFLAEFSRWAHFELTRKLNSSFDSMAIKLLSFLTAD